MSHRPAPPPPAFHSNRMEPLILMSGFLTKRTKTMSRWKKRWWQLLGDGSLLYFKGEARVRVLGRLALRALAYSPLPALCCKLPWYSPINQGLPQ